MLRRSGVGDACAPVELRRLRLPARGGNASGSHLPVKSTVERLAASRPPEGAAGLAGRLAGESAPVMLLDLERVRASPATPPLSPVAL
jgi:hypothetical protein